MKQLIVCIGFLMAISAQAQQVRKTYYDWQNTKLKEVFTVNSLGQKNGVYKKYDENGVLAVEATFKNDLMTGPGKEYYIYYQSQGPAKLKKVGSFKDADKHGVFVTYDYSFEGKLASQFEGYGYLSENQALAYAKCLKLGKQIKTLEEEYNFGKLIHQKSWYSNGQLASDVYVQTGNCVVYNEAGKLIMKFAMKDGKKDGYYLINGKNGKAFLAGKYSQGEKVGKWKICYAKSGNMVDVSNVDEQYVILTRDVFFPAQGPNKENLMEGDSLSTGYYLTGEKLDECYLFKEVSDQTYNIISAPLIDGRDSLHSIYRAYYKNGKLRMTGALRGGTILKYNIVNDEPILDIYSLSGDLRGTWIFYSPSGDEINRKEYQAITE